MMFYLTLILNRQALVYFGKQVCPDPRGVCLFVCFLRTPSIPQGYVATKRKHRRPVAAPAANHYIGNPPPPACAVRRARGMGPPYRKNGKDQRQEVYALSPSSSASHAIHLSIFEAWASSSSWPPSTVRPTPDNSRYRSSRPSHRGLDSRTFMLPGSRPSHASTLAAASLALGQWRRTWDLVMRAGPGQNQHLSSRRFLILFR